MHHDPSAHTHPTMAPLQRTMADVWDRFPGDAGELVGAVQQRVAQHAPLVPVHVGPVLDETLDHPTARPRPYRDPLEWLLLKHLVQAAFVASVVMFVLHGGAAPLMAIGYVGTGLLLIGVVVIADRQRFRDRDPDFEIVEFIAPPPRPVVQREPVVRQGALVPLVQQMQTVLPERVEVT